MIHLPLENVKRESFQSDRKKCGVEIQSNRNETSGVLEPLVAAISICPAPPDDKIPNASVILLNVRLRRRGGLMLAWAAEAA